MPFLTEIKSRLQSTQDMKKITQALELVAASKMRYFQKKALSTREYAWSLLDVLNMAEGTLEGHTFAEKRDNDGVLFVLVTSDKGLCGSLNLELSRKLFNSPLWKNTPKESRHIITIGKKSYESVLRNGVRPERHFLGLGEDLSPISALGVVQSITDLWDKGEISKVVLVSPHYVSPFESHVTFKTFLPMNKDMISTHLEFSKDKKQKEFSGDVDYIEPDEATIRKKIIEQMLLILFLQAFYELKASEYSSRMVAMKKATDAAGDIIYALSLEFNKVRQAIITQQLAELAGAMEEE